jgi:hypothetical protein
MYYRHVKNSASAKPQTPQATVPPRYVEFRRCIEISRQRWSSYVVTTLYKGYDFSGFFKVVQLHLHDPPLGYFHK